MRRVLGCLTVLLLLHGCSVDRDVGLAQGFDHELRTEHFTFRYNDDVATDVEDLARFSEGFLRFVNGGFFRARPRDRLHVYVLGTQSDFQRFLSDKMGVEEPPQFGMYLRDEHSIVTFSGAGIGTLAHEIVHPIVEAEMSGAPAWMVEGIPSFFEKFFGYWEGDRLVLHLGYQNPWRIRALGPRLTDLSLRQIVNHRGPDESVVSEERLVSVFLYEHGALKRLIRLVRERQRHGFGSYVEAAFERPWSEIEPLWRAYLEEVDVNAAATATIPQSIVLPDHADFLDFMRSHGLELDRWAS